jgi:hypothetical protein
VITAFHVVFGKIPDTGDTAVRPSIADCMESVAAWANVNGHRYVLHTPDDSLLEPTADRRFAADLERIRYAATCTPCIYFDWDILIRPPLPDGSGFHIPFPEYPMIGVPPIALFYLPVPGPALRTIELCGQYKEKHGVLHDNAVSDIFETSFWFEKHSYTHYNYHSLNNIGGIAGKEPV